MRPHTRPILPKTHIFATGILQDNNNNTVHVQLYPYYMHHAPCCACLLRPHLPDHSYGTSASAYRVPFRSFIRYESVGVDNNARSFIHTIRECVDLSFLFANPICIEGRTDCSIHMQRTQNRLQCARAHTHGYTHTHMSGSHRTDRPSSASECAGSAGESWPLF